MVDAKLLSGLKEDLRCKRFEQHRAGKEETEARGRVRIQQAPMYVGQAGGQEHGQAAGAPVTGQASASSHSTVVSKG